MTVTKFVFLDPGQDTLGIEICEAVGIAPECVRRMVIDLEVGSPGKVYIEAFADKSILDVSINKLGVQVVTEKSA